MATLPPSRSGESVGSVVRMQRVAHGKMNGKLRRMQGEPVVIEGTPFHSFTGHHRARVLVDVKSFRHGPVPMRPHPVPGP